MFGLECPLELQMMSKKSKYSTFCEINPKKSYVGLGVIAVNLNDKKFVWVLVKGKIHKNGWFKYWYNGTEGISNPYRWRNVTGLPEEKINEMIIKYNLSVLEQQNPRNESLNQLIGTAEYEPYIFDRLQPAEVEAENV